MKLTAFLSLVTILNVFGSESYAQSAKLNLDMKDVPIQTVLNAIENQSEFFFLYSSKMIDVTQKVDIQSGSKSISEVLDNLLESTDIKYTVKDRQILLVNKESVTDLNFQQKQITGKVTGADNASLPGVSVVVKGTTIGTVTGIDGSYSLSVPSNARTLSFSFVGLTTREVEIGNQTVLNIAMTESAIGLDEVVVVGYGTQKRANVTGAVSTISNESLSKNIAVTNTATAMQGLTPGLTVQDFGGEPGKENVTIRIRGTGTLNNANPLVLVDGIEQALSTVEPSNIESISVLKDAASASIYGSRAANGVILITTKRGIKSGTSVTYDVNVGIQNATYFPEKADPVTWLKLENEAQINSGAEPAHSDTYIQNVAAGTNPLQYPFANWEDGIFNYNAFQQRHALTLSTGGDFGRLFASVNYTDKDGIIQNFNNKQLTFSINSDMYVSKKLTVSLNLMYRNRDFSGPGHTAQRLVQGILHINRAMVMEYPDGTYDLLGGQWNTHAMVQHGETSSIANEIVGQGGFKYNFNEALSLEGNVTLNSTGTKGFVFTDALAGMRNYNTGELVAVSGWFAVPAMTSTQDNMSELSQRAYLNYSKIFSKHNIQAMAGYEEIYHKNDYLSAYRDGFFNNQLRDIDAGSRSNQTTGGNSSEWRLRSFFGRANYSFDDKYLFQANLRYDGSSRFGPGKRWGVFPSFSAGWRISNESFMKDNNVISNLRLRGSWGQLGNQNIGLYRYLSNYSLSQGYQFNNNLVSGAAITTAGNANITWETSTMTNIGMDIGFLKNRIEVVAEYFWKYTDDILLNLPIPRTVGVSPPTQNAAAVSNNGWEVSVNYTSPAKMDRGFQYSVEVNVSDVINKIEDLKGAGPFYPDKFSVWTEGESMNALRGLHSPPEGIYRTQADLDKYPVLYMPVVGLGDIIYEDLNGDGVISQSMAPTGDQIIMGSEDPRFQFGIRGNASYRGFDFSMFWQGVMKQFHSLDGALMEGSNWQNFITKEFARETYDPVRNPNGTWPKTTAGNSWNLLGADFWLQDTKYVRLKNFQIGYTILPRKLVSSLRIYVAGDNMLTFTPTELFDPETPRGRSQYMPQVKVLSAGISAKF